MWFQTVDELRGCSKDKEELILSCESCKATLVQSKKNNVLKNVGQCSHVF